MSSLNKVLLIGNLTRDPDLRFTAGGTAVCRLGLAVNRRFRQADGEAGEETCFVDVTVWGQTGENVAKYMRKGAPVLVEGRLQLDQWEDRQTGQKRSRLSVCAERVQFMGSARQDGGDGSGQESAPAARPPARPAARPPASPEMPPVGADDDIPF